MSKRVWIIFVAVQLAGLTAVAAGGSVPPTHRDKLCHLVALTLLEPGLLLILATFDKILHTRTPPEELFRYGAMLGTIVNTFFAVWAYQFFKALRHKRTN
jgi:hypothetical protein